MSIRRIHHQLAALIYGSQEVFLLKPCYELASHDSIVSMQDTQFKQRAGQYKTRVEAVMHDFVTLRLSSYSPLNAAIRYAIATEGKRIRSLLCYATAELLDLPLALADYPAAAIELIHTYSLIHDDLPAMDDDDLRRGKPTVHKQFDEASAILVGDALNTWAFELLAHADAPPALIVKWVKGLSRSAGAMGMIAGQAMDMEGETRCLSLAELTDMHRRKSGALIESSVTLIAMAGGSIDGGSIDELKQLNTFGHHIGLAFQIRDDILDVEASTARLGKPQGSDQANNKSTFVSLLGLDGAKKKMLDELDAANAALLPFGNKATGLQWIAGYITDRSY